MNTFCYFGIYQPTWARDTVLLKGLVTNGKKVILLTDSSAGWRKYWRLWRNHRRLQEPYDYLLVGYLSNVVVPLARLWTTKPVIFNAGNSMYEGAVLDRRGHSVFSLRRHLIWLIDFLAFHSAHLVLVESEAQRQFIHKRFLVSKRKLIRLWTGADDTVFHPDPGVAKRSTFTILFRGWFIPATGIEYVLGAAHLLRDREIKFVIIGRGLMLSWVEAKIKTDQLTNVELISAFLSEEDLRRRMLSCHVSLGQFSNHPRLDRTIQNKTFETLALGLPYITRDSKSNRELLTNKENCLFVKSADAKELTEKILSLKNDPDLRERLAQNGLTLYDRQLTPRAIAGSFLRIIAESRPL